MKRHKTILFFIAVSVIFMSGCITNWRQLKDISQASPSQIRHLRADIMRSHAMQVINAPQSLPQQRRWAPRRHFGPLYGNSPDIHLNGQGASFVYNSYFLNHPDATVFNKYYGSPLPSNQPTLAEALPGTTPSSDGFRDVRLGFDHLQYSSRYGGSFKLIFKSLENFQIEYRQGSDVWDISLLEMDVYVRPITTYFNPNSPISSVPAGYVKIEFHPQGVTAYTAAGLRVKEGDPMPTLHAALAESAETIVGNAGHIFRRDAARFSHGLVHAEFWNEIGQTNNVTAIEISDDFFFPRTSAGLPVATISFQAKNVRLNTEPGAEEIYITVDAAHMFQGVSIPPTFSWDFPEIDDGESTTWWTIGVFPLDWDCGQLETVILMLSVREEDDATFDDKFVTDPRAFQTGALDCTGMQTAFNNGQFGFYEYLPDEQLVILQDDEVKGALTARMRISVIKQ